MPLGQIARIVPAESRYMVAHDDSQRVDSVTFNVAGRSLQATVNDAKAKVAGLKLPAGVYVTFTGAAAAAQAAQLQMLLYTGFALMLIGLLLFISFRWRAHTWLVLVNLPFSLIGSVAAISLIGGGLSVGAMVGLVTVFGISARNAILLLSHYEHLVESEGAPWSHATLLRGAQERLVPILMTAAVTALGLMPLALGMNQPGQEIEGPMAVTVLGGLLSSTLLNLIVLPGLAEQFGGPRKRSGRRACMIRPLDVDFCAAHCCWPPAPTRRCRPLPPGDVPAAFEQASPNAPLWPSQDWWQGFGDAQLTQLIGTAETNNLDLAQAAARLRQADARARQAGAALLPTVGLNGTLNSLYGQANGVSQSETDYSAALGASYELDFWGKNRDALDSAKAARTASAADRATVALTVTSSLADDYFQLLSLRDRIATAKANLKSEADILALVQRRASCCGYAANADLIQQRAEMAAQQAALPALEQQELEARNALAILLGRPPESFRVAGDSLGTLTAPAVTPGLPSALLTRRPDIATAEANLRAAHADLAAARVAFLPDLTLTANGGIAYPALAAAVDTLPGTGLAAGLGAALVQTIFDGGKNTAITDEARAHEEELLAAYRAAVIAAFSDVENALADIAHLTAQEAALTDEVAQSEKVLGAAQRKYQSGYSDFLTVTDAERSLYMARDQLSDIRRARLVASVALFKALGGGWTDAALSP